MNRFQAPMLKERPSLRLKDLITQQLLILRIEHNAVTMTVNQSLFQWIKYPFNTLIQLNKGNDIYIRTLV